MRNLIKGTHSKYKQLKSVYLWLSLVFLQKVKLIILFSSYLHPYQSRLMTGSMSLWLSPPAETQLSFPDWKQGGCHSHPAHWSKLWHWTPVSPPVAAPLWECKTFVFQSPGCEIIGTLQRWGWGGIGCHRRPPELTMWEAWDFQTGIPLFLQPFLKTH